VLEAMAENLTPKQKKARFRQLARRHRLRTARAIAEERESPFLFPELACVDAQPKRQLGARRAKARGRT